MNNASQLHINKLLSTRKSSQCELIMTCNCKTATRNRPKEQVTWCTTVPRLSSYLGTFDASVSATGFRLWHSPRTKTGSQDASIVVMPENLKTNIHTVHDYLHFMCISQHYTERKQTYSNTFHIYSRWYFFDWLINYELLIHVVQNGRRMNVHRFF